MALSFFAALKSIRMSFSKISHESTCESSLYSSPWNDRIICLELNKVWILSYSFGMFQHQEVSNLSQVKISESFRRASSRNWLKKFCNTISEGDVRGIAHNSKLNNSIFCNIWEVFPLPSLEYRFLPRFQANVLSFVCYLIKVPLITIELQCVNFQLRLIRAQRHVDYDRDVNKTGKLFRRNNVWTVPGYNKHIYPFNYQPNLPSQELILFT